MTDQDLLNRTILACRKILTSPKFISIEHQYKPPFGKYITTVHDEADWYNAQLLLDKLLAVNDPILHESGFYCVECKSLCRPYEQGLCCDCDQPWITEVIDKEDYPNKWIPVQTVVTRE